MQKITSLLLFLHFGLTGCAQNRHSDYRRLKITQSAVRLTLSENNKLQENSLIDSVFVISTNNASNIIIAQLPVYPIDMLDSGGLEKSAVLDYFIYSTSSQNGLYFKKLGGLPISFILPIQS